MILAPEFHQTYHVTICLFFYGLKWFSGPGGSHMEEIQDKMSAPHIANTGDQECLLATACHC